MTNKREQCIHSRLVEAVYLLADGKAFRVSAPCVARRESRYVDDFSTVAYTTGVYVYQELRLAGGVLQSRAARLRPPHLSHLSSHDSLDH